jgi:hypothetical protein
METHVDEQLRDYRGQLTTLEQKTQEGYDKTVLSLSGGALGVSFAFVTNFVERGSMQASGLLVASWISWAVSVTATLASYFTSHLALRKAIRDVDSGKSVKRPGGWYDWITAGLNVTAGVLFLVGVVLVACFVWRNV